MVELLIVALLIGLLSDDSIETRERAAAELSRRGEAVRSVLFQTRPAVADAEARGRIDDVLGRLDVERRAREFGGSNRVCGLAASLRSDRWTGAGPFLLELEILNVGSEDRALRRLDSWDTELPESEIRVSKSQGRLFVRRFAGSAGLRRIRWRNGVDTEPEAIFLRPGENHRFRFGFDATGLADGDYLLIFEIYPNSLPAGAAESLRTQPLHLRVRRPP